MEGYLIRLPLCAWSVDDDAAVTTMRTRRSRRSCKPQARLLYYILGEGFLEGFASPDDVEPVESFQLTSFEVDVDPVYSMLMFKVTTREKRSVAQPSPPPHASGGDSSDDDDDDALWTVPSPATASGSSLLLFASDKTLVEAWCKKLVNWNRYVFAGSPSSGGNESDPIQAKSALVTAFHEKNNVGMFSIFCELQDCTASFGPGDAPPSTISRDLSAVISNDRFQPPRLSFPALFNEELPEVTAKPVRAEIKPLWMLLHHGSSRRIRSVPMTKK